MNTFSPTAKGWAQIALALAGYVAWTWWLWSRFGKWWSVLLGLLAGWFTAYAIRLLLGTQSSDIFQSNDPATATRAAAFLGLDPSPTIDV